MWNFIILLTLKSYFNLLSWKIRTFYSICSSTSLSSAELSVVVERLVLQRRRFESHWIYECEKENKRSLNPSFPDDQFFVGCDKKYFFLPLSFANNFQLLLALIGFFVVWLMFFHLTLFSGRIHCALVTNLGTRVNHSMALRPKHNCMNLHQSVIGWDSEKEKKPLALVSLAIKR